MATHPPFVPRAGQAPQLGVLRQRNRRSEFAIWWRELDRVLLAVVLALMVLGTAAVAAAMKPLARRAGDLAARYGGEEFVLLLPNTTSEGANDVAQELLSLVDSRQIPHKASSVGRFLSVSIGVASIVPDVHLAPSQLIDLADAALYAAKESGRHQIVVNDLG